MSGPHARTDRNRLFLLGLAFAIVGVALLAYLAVGLLHTLPPTYGHTLALFAAGAAGTLFLGTGILYLSVARKAVAPQVAEAGLRLGMDRRTGEHTWVPWSNLSGARLGAWRLSPWTRDPRFYELVLSKGGTDRPQESVHIVYLREPQRFVERMRGQLGNRLVLGPTLGSEA